MLLAVDLGVKTGLSLVGSDGRVRWYRSRNFGSAERLRRRVGAMLDEIDGLAWLILEGGGPLATIWQREAARRSISVMRISAEDWRESFLWPREHSDRRRAKQSATTLARRVIAWSGAKQPTSLRHDAAEAVLIGLWGAVKLGWLDGLPREIRG